MEEYIKTLLDGVSWIIVGTTLVGLLPPTAALLSILWLLVQFYDRFLNPERKGK